MNDRQTGRAIALATWLAELEALAGTGAWVDVRASLEHDLPAVQNSAELIMLYGESLLRVGLPREAFEWLAPRLDTMAAAANHRAWLRSVNLTGAAAFELGRITEAERYFEQAHEGAVKADDHLTCARALNNLALVASTRGEWSTAIRYYQLAIPSYERVASVRGIAECYHNIAATLIESGDLDGADDWDRQAMDLARETSNDRLWAFALGGRAEVRLRKRDSALALALAARAATAFRDLNDRASEAHALRLVGEAQHDQLLTSTAINTLTVAMSLAKESAVVRVLGECLLARARCFLNLGEHTSATLDLTEAREHFKALGASEKMQTVSRLLASIGETTDRPADARG